MAMDLQMLNNNANDPQRVAVEEPERPEIIHQQASAEVAPSTPQPKPNYRVKGCYYQILYERPQEFDFPMTSTKAAGLACGPSNRGLLHHVVLPSEHPAACPTLIEDTLALTAAKFVEAGVEVKMDNHMEHSLKSMVDPSLRNESYDGMIKTLQCDPNLRNDAEKQKALASLQAALNKGEQIPFEDMTKIINICVSISHVDHHQATIFVNRMKNANTLTDEQVNIVFDEAEPLYVDGKIRLSELQRLVEDCGRKGSKKTV